MRITRKLVEQLKATYRLMDWNISVRKTRAKKGDLGNALYLDDHKKALILLHPEVIKGERAGFVAETQMTTLHHEFAEIVMAAYEHVLPDEVARSKPFERYKDMLAEHWSRVVMEVSKR